MRQRGMTLVELAVAMAIVAVMAAGLVSLLAWTAGTGRRETAMTENALLAEQALAQAARWVRASCDVQVGGAAPQQVLTLVLPGRDGSCPSAGSPNSVQIFLQGAQPVVVRNGTILPLAPGLTVSGFSATVQKDSGQRTVALSLTVGGRTYGTVVMPRMGK